MAKKIRLHVDTWRAAGHDVELFAFAPAPLRERWAATGRLVREVRAWAPELVYLRFDVFLPPIRQLLIDFPTVVEVNSYDRRELRLRTRRVSLYGELNRRLLLGPAAGVVCVAEELTELLAPLRRPAAVVPNGVDLEAIAATPAPRNERPRLVYAGSPWQGWQGLDKLVQLAVAEPEWHFDVVGPRPAELRGAPENVTVHGFLDRERYAPLYARADAAVGQLALHRRGVDENSPLKVREYLAYGLPVISGHRDPDFPGPAPWFLLRLPNNEANVRRHLNDIRAFVEHVRGRRVAHEEIAHLDVRVKEAARLDFMQRMLREARAHTG